MGMIKKRELINQSTNGKFLTGNSLDKSKLAGRYTIDENEIQGKKNN